MKAFITGITTAALLAGSATTAFAGGRHYQDGYYDFARVLRAEPITEVERVAQPREVCWKERVTRTVPRRRNSATPEIVGGIIGGVVGNQFGHGSGKSIATVAGAILGGSIAHDMERGRAYAYDHYSEPVERCRVEQDYYEEERVVGYDVTYRYNGQIYHTRLDHDPGRRVRVRVGVGIAE